MKSQNTDDMKFIWIFLLGSSLLMAQSSTITLTPVAEGFRQPTDLAHTGVDGDNRLFVVEKRGTIQVWDPSTETATEFLDIRSRVNSSANERGLLGLCFHPDYASNGYFYVHYTNASGQSTISRFSRSDNDENFADPNTEKIILQVSHPFNNHNAGDLEFGSDGYLYIGMGDGGSGGDPGNRSQNPTTLLGKMLRIDVNTEAAPYVIPQDNPYAGQSDTLPEIWALGLRNPWRFSFDRQLNDLWIADVGQNDWEEINRVSATEGGLNYGWRCYEGLTRFNFAGCNDDVGYTFPVFVYPNRFDVGCSVTGGFVYRGTQEADLIGKYIYADFCSGIFWALSQDTDGQWSNERLGQFQTQEFVTFGEDINGELYVAGIGNGQIFKVKSLTSTTRDWDKNVSWTISPNPATHHITIKVTSDMPRSSQACITDVMGVVVREFSISSESTTQIDISDLPRGSYFVRPSDGSGEGHIFIKYE